MADLFKATGTIHIDTSKIPEQVMEAAKEAQKTADKNSIKISITTDSKVMEKQLKKDQATLFKELKDSYDKIGEGKIGSNAFAKSVQMYVASGGELNNAFKEIAEYYETLKKELKGNFLPIDQIELFKDALASLKNVGGNIDNSGIEELQKEIQEVKEDITSLKGRVDTLEDVTAFDTLSSKAKDFNKEIKDINSSAIDLQKALIPLYDGINKVYQAKNGKQISGYWDELKKQIDESDGELKELLKTIGLYDSQSDSLKLISDGMVNSGGLVGDERVLIARKNKSDRLEQTHALKKALDEAYASGINVSRILDIVGTKESGVFLELQETAKGNVLGNIYGQLDKDFVNTEWLEATDEQIKKLISDMIALQKIGINVESNLTNIMYDKKKGFSFIDMDLDITKFENDAELLEDHMIRIFGDLEDFYLDQNDTANANIIAKARERFESLSEQVQQAYATAQDSHSPSKEFEKLENDAVDGIVEGANKNEDKLKNVGKQMADNVKAGFKEGMSETDGTTLPSGEDQSSVLSGDSGAPLVEDLREVKTESEQAEKSVNDLRNQLLKLAKNDSLKSSDISSILGLDEDFVKSRMLDLSFGGATTKQIIDDFILSYQRINEASSISAQERQEDEKKVQKEIKNTEYTLRDFYKQYHPGLKEKTVDAKINVDKNEIIKQLGEKDSQKGITGAVGMFTDPSGISNMDLDKFKAYRTELEKLGYTLGQIQWDKNSYIASAKIIPIDDNAVKNAEEMRRILLDTSSQVNQTPLLSPEVKDAEKIVEVNREVAESYDKATESKKKYNIVSKYDIPKLANKSAIESTPAITEEASAAEKVADNMSEAANAKDAFAKANQKVENSAIDSSSALNKEANNVREVTDAIEENTKAQEKNSKTKKKVVVTNPSQEGFKPQDGWVKGVNKAWEQAIKENNQRSGESLVANYKNIFNGLASADNKIDEYKTKLEDLNWVINEIENQYPMDITNQEAINKLKTLEDSAKNIINDLGDPKYNLAETVDIDKLSGKISNVLNKNTAMPKELRASFEELREQLKKTGLTANEIKKIEDNFISLKSQMIATGKTGASVGDKIKKKFGDVAAYFATYVSIYDFINIMRQGFETIKEYDKALTEMNKVSDESISTLKDFQKESFELADAIGAIANTVQNSTADWMRLGESLEEAKKSAEATNILLNVSEFKSIDAATDSLVSMSQAYKDLEKMDIVDIMNNIGNNYAISTDGLASALQRSASALTTAGNDINEAVALVTAGNAVVQDAESVGTGMQTIALRLVGTKEAKDQLEELGEETDGVITTISKLRDTILSATKAASEDGKGFDILDANGNYKSTYEIMYGLADMYDEIVKKDKELGTNNLNLLLETLAGKRRANIAASILQNKELLSSVYDSSLDSEGSALKENEAYLESIEGHLNQLKNTYDSLWVNEHNREVITFFLDLAKGVLEVVDNIGVLNTALIGLGAGVGIKSAISGGGRAKCCSFSEYATGEFSSDVYELCVA